MGFKLKKAFKNVVKVATLGAVDGSKGGWLGGTKGIMNTFTLGVASPEDGPFKGPLGMSAGTMAASKSAEEQANLTRLQTDQQNQQLAAMQSNYQADLRGENLSNVVAGGSAAESAYGGLQKRKKGAGLSSTLGFG